MPNWLRRLLPIAAVLSTAGVLVANQVGAMAYTSGSTGYDISYPQCGGHYPTGAFGIVGVNGGYPFVHYNPCLADEYGHTPNAALYINTGYDPIYTQVDGKHSTPECVTQSASIQGTSPQQAAWGVGCSEASRSIAYATSQGATSLSSWLLDIETSNSWSSAGSNSRPASLSHRADPLLYSFGDEPSHPPLPNRRTPTAPPLDVRPGMWQAVRTGADHGSSVPVPEDRWSGSGRAG